MPAPLTDVTDLAHNHGRDTAGHFRRLYLIALSVIAALAIGGQVLVQQALITQRGDSHIVNKAGYQRMLSQRITLKMLLFDHTQPGAAAGFQAIAAMRDRWVAAHLDLAREVNRIAYDAAARDSLADLFDRAGRPLRQISALVTTLAHENALTASEREALLADQEQFLPLMDAVVLGFDLSGQARVGFLQRTELTLLLITLAVLALEAFLIFRPAVHRLQVSLDELERRNQQATHRLESLRHLTGGISHHFNNLLTGIMGHAELERLDAVHHQRNTEYLDAQLSGCKRAADIITHLERYSGRGSYVCEPTALGAWLVEVAGSFQPKNPGVRIEVHVTEDAIAPVDRVEFRHALEGLLENAVEAMKGRAGIVTLHLSQDVFTEPKLMSGPYCAELPPGLYARIKVIDAGEGIAPENLDRIFDPFFSNKEFGRGLGLAAVLGIAHGHNGGIMVESVPGRGSTASLFLPLLGPDARIPSPRKPERVRMV